MKVLVIKPMPGRMSFSPFNNFHFNIFSDTLRCIKNASCCDQEELAKHIRKAGTARRKIPLNITCNRKEVYFVVMQLKRNFYMLQSFLLWKPSSHYLWKAAWTPTEKIDHIHAISKFRSLQARVGITSQWQPGRKDCAFRLMVLPKKKK